MNALAEFDTWLFVLLNQDLTSPFLDVVMPFLTDFDHWRYPVILILLVVLARGSTSTRVAVLFAILAVAAADQLAASGIKPLVERIRPFHVIEGTRKLVSAHSTSFPSAHAANTFAAGTFLALRFRRMRAILIVAALVGYSRVYVGVHYPFDVVGGAALGILVGVSFFAIERVSRGRLSAVFRRRRGQPPPPPSPSG